jgi:SAM-dependent methyltransferase
VPGGEHALGHRPAVVAAEQQRDELAPARGEVVSEEPDRPCRRSSPHQRRPFGDDPSRARATCGRADAGEAFKAFEADGWSARAQTYDGLTGAITARLVEPLLDAAGVRGDAVLDVATGPGRVAERAATRAAMPVGVDLAEGMLELARRRNPEIEFVRADAEQLPFEDETFEAAVGGFVLNHLPRPERAVAKAARVVCAGGGVAFSVWDRPERMRVIGVLRDTIAAAGAEHDAQMPEGAPNPYRLADDTGFGRLLRERDSPR